jgi:hypothetical protein
MNMPTTKAPIPYVTYCACSFPNSFLPIYIIIRPIKIRTRTIRERNDTRQLAPGLVVDAIVPNMEKIEKIDPSIINRRPVSVLLVGILPSIAISPARK